MKEFLFVLAYENDQLIGDAQNEVMVFYSESDAEGARAQIQDGALMKVSVVKFQRVES